jgi:hypothetical protein
MSHPADPKNNLKFILGRRGEVIEESVDLCKKFNVPGYPPKYEQVPDDTPITCVQYLEAVASIPKTPQTVSTKPTTDDFDAMDVSQLRQWAANEEVDLGRLSKKEDILKAIRSHLADR